MNFFGIIGVQVMGLARCGGGKLRLIVNEIETGEKRPTFDEISILVHHLPGDFDRFLGLILSLQKLNQQHAALKTFRAHLYSIF